MEDMDAYKKGLVEVARRVVVKHMQGLCKGMD